MNYHADIHPAEESHHGGALVSPVATDRVRGLAERVIEGAPALTSGEMRELARAILEHNALSEQND